MGGMLRHLPVRVSLDVLRSKAPYRGDAGLRNTILRASCALTLRYADPRSDIVAVPEV